MRKIDMDRQRKSSLHINLWTLIVASFFFVLFITFGYSGSGSYRETKAMAAGSESTAGTSGPGNSTRTLVKKPRTLTGRVGMQNTLYDILTAHSVSPRAINEVVRAARPLFNLNKIKAGNAYRLAFSDAGELLSIEYEIDDQKLIRLVKAEGIFRAKLDKIDYQTRRAAFSGRINTNLYEAIVDGGESPSLVVQLAEIFAWDIDFNTDLRKGDSFSLIAEKMFRDGEYVRGGRILAAEFTNRGRLFQAIYFNGASGRGDYYTYSGKSLRKQFLKAPLSYSYISSGYTKKRLHPVLKKYLPHEGVDYVAPRGTPVVAVGDGKVLWAGRKGRNGIFVKLKHNGVYTSSYGHLSRLGKGVKKGAWVKQGRVIGYVGSTGTATGSHLDYRIRKNGAYIDPLKMKTSPSKSISREQLKAFEALRQKISRQLVVAKENMNSRGKAKTSH